jgi:hypothetical protein
MVCIQQGWDSILKAEMATEFSDTDGVLWHWDGDKNTRMAYMGSSDQYKMKGGLNTMCILGRKYYERFNYIYHPEYRSLFCDNEFTEVANNLGKQKYFDLVLFKHEHFSNTPGLRQDALMMRTQSFYSIDNLTFQRRKQLNFK